MLTLPGYKVLNCLYEGTSSTIYQALRLSDELPVVVKVSTQKALTEKKIQRFQREFEINKQIDSPYVVRYLELIEDPTYGVALIMEDDGSVELTSCIPEKGFSNEEFLEIATQIVQGLQVIHAANIVHNDLNPSNILIQPENKRIKIIDFNRASTVQQEMQPAIRKPVGTLAYISPEQTGRVNRSVDYRTDFYALGVTFYQLLCGQLPFTAEDALGFIYQHLAEQPQPLEYYKSTIALPLAQVIMKLLEKNAENRYQSCEGILHDLNHCLAALKKTGTIPEFELGQNDFSSKLTLSQYLYGRELEIKILIGAFERASQGSREVLMVTGQPGVGKTMLIQEIRQSIDLKNGYFISGKFDQLNKNVAYSALTQAFDSLVKQWLAEDEASISHWKNQLLSALGAHAQLISKLVPTLTLLIGEQPTLFIADINQAKNIFYLVFQKFVTLCANAAHPLVIFLDDLQWADYASLELMTYLLQQPNINHLLWLGAYRDSEVTASHPIIQTVTTLREAQVCIQTLILAPLSLVSLQTWIADSLHMPPNTVSSLTELIYKKTAGNPFFVKHFLQSLYEQRLLTFSAQSRWQWDIDKIRQHPATENVITLMTYQIQQLPSITQKALSIASCLGHYLTFCILQTAMAATSEDMSQALQPALNSGILIQQDNDVFFAHDRVQEAAYHLISENEKAPTHFTIGQRLLASLASEKEWLLDIVDQFNRCRSLVTASEMRLQLAHLNLQASQKVKQFTAYKAALNYLYASRDWVNIQDLWQNDYSFCFTLCKELAEVEYLSGNFKSSEILIRDILPHLQSTLHKVEIYHLWIIQKMVQGKLLEAITLSREALQLINIDLLLLNKSVKAIGQKLLLLKEKLAKIPFHSLLNAPLAVETDKQALFKILADLISACYLIGSELLPAVTIMTINLSLEHGNAPESCLAYVVFGLLLCSEFQEYTLGYEFVDFAIQLAKKLNSPSQECRCKVFMYGVIYPWSKSIQHVPELEASTYEACIACGEIEYAGYSGSRVNPMFDRGTSLSMVQKEIFTVLEFAKSTKTKSVILTMMEGLLRIIANLLGETSDKDNFTYAGMNEKEFEDNCQKTASGLSLYLYYIRKTQVLYLYGSFNEAFENLALAKNYMKFIRGDYTTALFNWYHSLICLALYPTASLEEQQAYLQQVTQNQQRMQVWQTNCAENFAHKYYLVEAEIARVQNNYSQAEKHYNLSITLAGEHGFIHEQALGAELVAQYWIARNTPLCAHGYLNMAFNGYKQWGAKRKLALFSSKYADILQALAPPTLSQLIINQQTTLGGDTLKLLDLASIIKASHAISTEIELPKFLRGMMQIIIENAGAQQGALLFVEADETISVQAEHANEGKDLITLQNIPLADWENGAHAVIQFVKRTRQSVVIGNAMTDERFKADPYINRTQTKSILCIPLLKHSELKAILYLENNLMCDAFTSERVHTVLILTAQMTISLENARYFAEQIALARQLAEQSARAEMAEKSLSSVTHNLELALQASKAGTWNWQIETDNMSWDAANCALFGITSKEFKGKYTNFLECVHPDDRERLNQDIKQCMEQGLFFDLEFRVIWPDRSEHTISGKGRVYRDKEDRPIKMAGVCIDVTQRKQLEDERLQALKRAEEKERHRAEEAEKYRRDLEDFINMICHEIRNPMSGIYGNIDFLQQTIISLRPFNENITQEKQSAFSELLQKLEESTQEIQQCVKHQKAIIDDVLDLSKIEAGKMEFKHEPFRLKALIKETAQIFDALVKKKHLRLQVVTPDVDLWVKGDVNRIKMVLINLIANALKFTERGEIKIHLQLMKITSTYTTFTISVEDTGIGMTAQEQSQLFQRFARVAAAEYEGSGLGLMISKRFIERMGGHIDVKSEKGKGSQFTIQLTCETAPAEIKLAPLTAQDAPLPSATVSPITRRILIVEDNIVNQKILRRQLETEGYNCEIANNGQEAVDKWRTGSFDLIFMDIEMPVMNGFDATKVIRECEQQFDIARKVPIVALSAYASKDFVQQAHSMGMDDYITKPYEKNKLLDALKKWTISPPAPSPSQQPSADTLLALSLVQSLTALQPIISPISTDQTQQAKSSFPFWSQPQSVTIQQPTRIWMPEPRRNALYPVLDRLTNALSTLNVSIIKPEAKYQAKASHTGWQLYCYKETNECLAVLNFAQEAHVDRLLEIIRQTDTPLQANKMHSGSVHLLAITFNNDNILIRDIEKFIFNLQAQQHLRPLSH